MAHVVACERRPVTRVAHLLPQHYRETLEHNQKIASCCRATENHEIGAFYSSEEWAKTGIPDIYIFYCTCGRLHRRFCMGSGDVRPKWECR
jgi:hypothetical protein